MRIPLVQGRFVSLAGRYAEHAPAASVCCNACRSCATTNAAAVGVAVAAAAVGLLRGRGRGERREDEPAG